MFTSLRPVACILAMCAATSLPAQDAPEAKIIKAQMIEDTGASERINLSGKLRMLSQRMPGSTCFAASGIDVDNSAKIVAAAAAEFEKIINGLEFGDPDLNINKVEEDRKVLMKIADTRAVWTEMKAAIEANFQKAPEDWDIGAVAHFGPSLLNAAKLLVPEITREYGDPTAVLAADALTIDLAGRQRMLAQHISKNACLPTAGIETEVAIGRLTKARPLYEATAKALRFGMPEIGMKATKNPVILSKLDDVLALWFEVQPILDRVQAGEKISQDELVIVFNDMNSLTAQMNTIVGIYSDDSKQGL